MDILKLSARASQLTAAMRLNPAAAISKDNDGITYAANGSWTLKLKGYTGAMTMCEIIAWIDGLTFADSDEVRHPWSGHDSCGEIIEMAATSGTESIVIIPDPVLFDDDLTPWRKKKQQA